MSNVQIGSEASWVGNVLTFAFGSIEFFAIFAEKSKKFLQPSCCLRKKLYINQVK